MDKKINSSQNPRLKRRLSLKKRIVFSIFVIVFLLVITLVLVESALHYLDDTRSEGVLDYGDLFDEDTLRIGGFLHENIQTEVTDGYGGTVRWITNSQGFRNEKEFSRERSPGVLRILSMGDSFAAGYRVDQKNTYSYLLEDYLNQNSGITEILVSLVQNPGHGLYYLHRYGTTFNPHIVLLGITLGNDIAESYISLDPQGTYILEADSGAVCVSNNTEEPKIGFLHGLEKYDLPEDCLEARGAMKMLGDSIVRRIDKLRCLNYFRPQTRGIRSWYGSHKYDKPKLFDATHGLGFYIADPPPVIEEAYQRLFRILAGMQRICRDKGIVFIVCLFPQRFQVQPKCWSRAVRDYGLRESAFDLDAPNRKLAAFCESEEINCLDPLDSLRRWHEDTGVELYLPRGDMHWNRLGHEVFVDAIKEDLLNLIRPVTLSR